MKALLLASLLISTSAMAQVLTQCQSSTFGQYTTYASRIEAIQTSTQGYVTPEEIRNNDVKVEGVSINQDRLIFDASNPQLDVTSVVMSNGRQVDIARVDGGDMGGGGRIIQNDMSRNFSIIQR